jgi:hypothetical protein
MCVPRTASSDHFREVAILVSPYPTLAKPDRTAAVRGETEAERPLCRGRLQLSQVGLCDPSAVRQT